MTNLSKVIREKLQNPQDVDLLEVDGGVAAHQADGQDLDGLAPVLLQGHEDGHRVVDAGVGVDDQLRDFAGHLQLQTQNNSLSVVLASFFGLKAPSWPCQYPGESHLQGSSCKLL